MALARKRVGPQGQWWQSRTNFRANHRSRPDGPLPPLPDLGKFKAELRQAVRTALESTHHDKVGGSRWYEHMLERFSKALLRALAMAFTVITPALLLPWTDVTTSQFAVFMALVAGIFTFSEYHAASPSLISFRDAAPFNRIRFTALVVMVMGVALILRDDIAPTTLSRVMSAFGAVAADLLDFPYSPVRLLAALAPPEEAARLSRAAGLCYLVGILAILALSIVLRMSQWPARRGAFNIWVNLPLFGVALFGDGRQGDLRLRFIWEARVNLILGILLPFFLPVAALWWTGGASPAAFSVPHVMVWWVAAWALVPAGLVMRGIAFWRLSQMIAEQRKRALAPDGAWRAA